MRYKRKQLYLMCLNNTVNILCFTAIFIATVALIIFYSDASKITDKLTQNNTYVILPNRTTLKILEENYPIKPTPSTYESTKHAVTDVITTTKRNEASDHGINNRHGQKKQPTTFNEYTTKSIIPPVVRTTEKNTNIKSNVNNVKASIICKTLPQKDDFAKCGSRKADMKCCEYIWAMNYKYDILEHLNCISKSSYGSNDSPAMFPHMVAIGWLRKDDRDKYQFRCSGSLISNKFVLTSARCIITENISTEPNPRIVRLGVDNINKTNDNDNDVEIDTPIYHPLYLPSQPYHDVALLKLKTSVIFTKKIHPACISTSLSTARFTKVNVTGWEVSNFGSKELFGRLQKSTLNMIRYETCHTKLEENTAFNEVWKKLQMHQLCADVEGGSNIWQGASGSPIQVKINTKSGYMHTVIGVTSMSLIKGSNNLPGIYTSVSSVLTWIENTVWSEDEKDKFTSKYT